MADAFRGLTIRLGADARPLKSAIDSVTKSAGAAQKQMNMLNKALKFDPTNVKLMGSRLDLVGDKAAHSARGFEKIRSAMRQATSESGEMLKRIGMTAEEFKKLTNETTSAYAATQKVRDELYTVDASLQHIYDDAARVARITEKGMKLDESSSIEWIKMLRQEMRGEGEDAKKARELLESYIKEAAGLKGVAEKFGLVEGEGEKLVAVYDKLVEHHLKLEAQQETMNAVEGFRAARYQAQAFKAEVLGASIEAAKLQTEMYSLGTRGGLSRAITQMKLFTEASEKATANAQQMIAAYKAQPKNLSAAVAKIRAVAAAEETLKNETKAINDALDKIRRDPAFDKQAASSRKAYVKAVELENQYAKLNMGLKLSEARLEFFKKQLNNMRDSGVDEASADFKKCEENIEKCDARVKIFKEHLDAISGKHEAAALTTQFHNLNAQLAEATTKAAALHSQVSKLRAISNLGKGMREFGFGMYASLTPAIMMAGRYAIDAARDVDSAYRDMRKTVNGTEEDFEHLKEAAIDFSRTHVTSADTMLEIEAMGGQLGIMVGDLEEFGHTVSNLDIATNLDSDTIAQDLGKMATVMGLTVDEYDNFGDALVRLGNNMPAMETDIMNSAMRFMGMGKVVGLSADQVLAWATAAVSTGQKAEAAGSSMQRFMSNMETATTAGGDALEKWARVAGMSADEFKEKFETDASGAMYAFIAGLAEMQKNGESVNQQLMELGINNVRDKQLIEGLANQMANAAKSGNVLGDSLRYSSDAYNGFSSVTKDGSIEEAGDAMREAEKKSAGFSGEFEKMCNNAKALAVELGDASIPILKELGSVFQELTGWVHELPDGIKEMAVKLGIFLALIGPLSVGFGTFFQTFEKIRNGFVGIQGVFVSAAAKLNAMTVSTNAGMAANIGLQNALLGLSKTPVLIGITAITAAIAALGGALEERRKQLETFKKATEGMAEVSRRASLLGSGQAESLEETGKQADSAAKSVNELIDTTAKLVDTQNERLASSEKDIAQLKEAQRIINTYANTDMSGNVSAQAQFRAAVELVNEKCGKQYQVIDAVNGVLADETGKLEGVVGALNEYVKAQEMQIRSDQLIQKLSEDNQQLDIAIATYAEAKKAMQEYNGQDVKKQTELQENAEKALVAMNELSDAVARDEAALGNTVAAADEATRSIENLTKSNSTLLGILSDAEMDDFAAGLKNAGMTIEEFGKVSKMEWGEAAMAWRDSGYDMGVAMDTLGIKVKSMSDQYKAEMKAATGSTETWKAALKTTKMDGDELAAALDGAGISAAEFSQVGAKSFQALWQSANGDMSKIQTDLMLLNAAGIDPKSLRVDDSGVLLAKDQVIQLDGELAKVGDREFHWTGTGFEEIKQQVSEVDEEMSGVEEIEVEADTAELDTTEDKINAVQEAAEQGVNIEVTAEDTANIESFMSLIDELKSIGSIGVSTSLSVDTSGIEKAQGAWDSLKGAVGGGISGKVSVDSSGATSAKKNVDTLSAAVKNIPPKQIKITVTGGALSDIKAIKDELSTMTTYKEITIHTKHTNDGQTATGGIVPAHAAGALIPRHAAGAINGIATHAMMTNIGWVGEAGAEAIFHMRNAGGAVVPLSNRRYVRPFAHAVASEMGGGGSTSVVNHVTVQLTYDSTKEARQMARDITDELNSILAMGA